jgi:hypothetical protein
MLEIAVCGLCGADCSMSELSLFEDDELCPRCYRGAVSAQNPLIMEGDDLSVLRRVLSDQLQRSVTDKELANFVEAYNAGVIGYAENYIGELVNDLDEWLEEEED